MEPDRHILIVDRPDGELQQLAMDLLSRDFEVHYANDLDEARLLAGETGRQINAVLFTAGIEIEHIPDLAARFGVTPDALIPFGQRPPDRVVAALAHHGVLWHLWDDPPDQTIRFVISGVLHDHDPSELRYHLRVPTNLEAQLKVRDQKSATAIRDIGLGGACLVGGVLGDEGSEGQLFFCIENRPISLPIRTAWAAPDANDAVSVGGVSFREVDPESGEILDQLMRSVVDRNRIRKAD